MYEIKLPTCVTCLMINEAGMVAAVDRRDGPGLIGFPGGKIDPGETPEIAMVREAREEISVVLKRLYPIYAGPGRTRWCQGFISYHLYNLPLRPGPGEQPAAWVDPCVLLGEPFGDYNRALYDQAIQHFVGITDGPFRHAFLRMVDMLNKGAVVTSDSSVTVAHH